MLLRVPQPVRVPQTSLSTRPRKLPVPDIRQLPPSVVNKIAAGEVIERPASVVKELVENALDAGATRIDVVLEQGGRELIRVVDNGCGIAPDQVLLATAPHATSKLQDAEDLFRVRTLGFRGEALASIAEVSRLTLRTRPPENPGGVELEVHGGAHGQPVPCGCSPGTTIEVAQLFFNTPARRKFLKSPQTEMGHILEAFTRLALAYPQHHFTLKHGTRVLHDLPPSPRSIERVIGLFGRELGEKLLWIESQDEEVTLRGYVGHPRESRSHPRMQYLFLNGRYIRDRALQHALTEAYRGLLLTGRYPVAFLSLDMSPELVDVNVHPTKLEVRFADSGRHYSQLLGTLRRKFLETDLNHPGQAPPSAGEASTAALDEQAERSRQELLAWANEQMAAWPATNATQSTATVSAAPASAATSGPASFLEKSSVSPLAQKTPLYYSLEESVAENSPRIVQTAREAAASSPASELFSSDELRTLAPALADARWAASSAARSGHGPIAVQKGETAALQVCDRYLVTEEEGSVIIIDQHALHERVLYEQLRQRVLSGKLETQRLLLPVPVDLAAEEAAAVLDHQELLKQLGLEVSGFGGATVLLGSHPAMLARCEPESLLREVASALMAGGKLPERRDLLDALLHQMSCKAAIKAGDRLTPEEIAALLTQRHLAQDAHHCPHGRPTALVFTREELDKQFKRT